VAATSVLHSYWAVTDVGARAIAPPGWERAQAQLGRGGTFRATALVSPANGFPALQPAISLYISRHGLTQNGTHVVIQTLAMYTL
jgi:hypothetical protein